MEKKEKRRTWLPLMVVVYFRYKGDMKESKPDAEASERVQNKQDLCLGRALCEREAGGERKREEPGAMAKRTKEASATTMARL